MLKRVSDPAMLAHVEKMGALLMGRLRELGSPHIKDVRGLGLMIGVEMDVPVASVVQAGYERGVILLNAGENVLRLLPPLIVTEKEIDRLMEVLGEIIPH